MSPVSVFATSLSRLHAELIIIRLTRSGISGGSISAIHPPGSCPGANGAWFTGSSRVFLFNGEKMFVSGRLRRKLAECGAPDESLERRLVALGLTGAHSRGVAEALAHHGIVLCVEAGDESELDGILQILQVSDATGICFVEALAGPGPAAALSPAGAAV